ncbi:galactokinase [Pontibacillus halophilus JSM 076056 = DSM 19796]|uniref:Galactokinase n=1 Tax=Pontibacillus halophilus JSM 076056 = DSM 19796 TaxID=1385510 RepID=A0A0A5GKG9_9BACI|nr:galactokinase [Pontibacillus halophilus]KGX91655.1 galactokinase [Pontibacillus halophilus JSM 076056 = DSM 19796]
MKALEQAFMEKFGEGEEVASFFAPGRVNLIGEHTDYNGGHVFPCALSVGTYAVARKRKDSILRFYSMNFEEQGVIEATIDDLHYVESDDWANYPKGVIEQFRQAGHRVETGYEVAFYGNIPNGAGLSSSASIELATAVMIKELEGLKVTELDMIQLSQKAENEFVGVNCGIMDQFAIGKGKKDHAILLNCDTLDYRHTPVKLKKESLIIANTNKRRGLADSAYNERRTQCEEAVKDLQHRLPIQSLGEVTEEQFQQYESLIQSEDVKRRAKHVITENARTIQAVDYLDNGDIEGFGRLMNESHKSLRDDYEVTGEELDALVEAAWDQGAIGSRMTGAGFGGCTISIVPNEKVEAFIHAVSERYTERTGLVADFYTVEIGDGAKRL